MRRGRGLQRFTLAVLVILIGAGLVGVLTFLDIPGNNERVLNIALGLVLAWGGNAVNFYFGSSEGSSRKTELLERPATGKPDDPVHVEEEGVIR